MTTDSFLRIETYHTDITDVRSFSCDHNTITE